MSPAGRALLLHLLAFLSGGLLAVMLLLNGTLAATTTPAYSSWVAHGTGAVVALALLLAMSVRNRQVWFGGAPGWAFLGGASGAMTVTLTGIAVNSSLALAGTLAFGLVGQAVFGLLADRFGLFGLPRRRPTSRDFAALALILGGSFLLIYGAAL
jgi:transporter family-2 protein